VLEVWLGADVIVGFPGESDVEFERTLALVERSSLDYLHVFSWSARPGTTAATLPERVHTREIRRRSSRLRALGRRKFLEFRRRFQGRLLDAVMLGPGRTDGEPRALSGNFIETKLTGPSAASRELVRVRVERVETDATWATIDGVPDWADPASGSSGA